MSITYRKTTIQVRRKLGNKNFPNTPRGAKEAIIYDRDLGKMLRARADEARKKKRQLAIENKIREKKGLKKKLSPMKRKERTLENKRLKAVLATATELKSGGDLFASFLASVLESDVKRELVHRELLRDL